MASLQTKEELEAFYKSSPDPWAFDQNPADTTRMARLLALLPKRPFRRTLDIGCGNGFVTVKLPGNAVIGCDLSANALAWARQRADRSATPDRFQFRPLSIFDMNSNILGTFDLVVITGVLYPQYIGRGFSTIRQIVDSLIEENGVLATMHIDEWCPWRFPYTLLDAELSPYSQYTHRTEIFLKMRS